MSRREIVEAAAFERRRLATALLTGDPESERPGVAGLLIGGVVLAAVVVGLQVAARLL